MIEKLRNYEPKDVEYFLSDSAKDLFPMELDFTGITYKGKKIKTQADSMKLIGKEFNATFPSNETVERKLDDFEISNIREEYCVKCENDLPEREQHYEDTLEQIKVMKKKAEEALAAVRQDIAKYAAQVKQGTQEVRLKNGETFCIALAGWYAYYTYDRNKKKYVLAKAFQVSDPTEIWAQEDKNRKAMAEFFHLDFPEPEKPETEGEKEDDNEGDGEGDNLPFADEKEV